ncbi:unnamed protein product, partial [Strongylus vulgaris]
MIGLVEVADTGNHSLQYDIAEGGQGVIAIDDLGMLTYHGEHTKRGTTVATIEMTDADDDAAVQLSIESISGIFLNGSESHQLNAKMFKTKMNGRKADVVLDERIYDLPLASLSIEMRAQDHAHASEPFALVTLHLAVTRKHPLIVQRPIPFKFIEVPKIVKISADSPIGTIVYTPRLLQSIISNATEFSYGLDSLSDGFGIDNSTGTITTLRSLHDLTEDELTITASSLTEEQSAQVNLTVIITPALTHTVTFMERQYQASVGQSDPLDTAVLAVKAKTNRGEELKSYSLEGLDADYFTIDNKGVIRLKESVATVPKSSLSFVATAGNGMAKSSVPVRVLIKKEESEEIAFEKNSYEIKVMENIPLNGYVLHPQLINGKHEGVDYSLNTQNDATVIAQLLEIDGNGRITVKEELLGYVGTYEFQVRAVKGEHHASTDVTMRILPAYRCVPAFIGDRNLEFLINELVLGLQAGAHQFAQMSSTIRVRDVDDHPLEAVLSRVTVEVPEDAAVGTIIATMRAIDADKMQKIFYRLRETSKEFSVNSSTGEVVLTSGLDRETKSLYALQIGASNDEDARIDDIEVWMSLNIIVTDVNDNGPLFEESRYSVLVAKNALPGEQILTVRAFDPDQPTADNDMKEVYYRIKEMLFDYHGMSRAVENMFSIGQTSGVVRLEQSVSEFVGGVFHLLLESRDSLESDAHRDQCIVKAYVHDDSDVVRMELPIPPAALTYEKISTMKGTIANATGLKAMIKDLQYHHEEGNLVYDVTDLRLVLVNRTTSEIIPAERAIAIADKRRSAMGDRIPSMTKAQ